MQARRPAEAAGAGFERSRAGARRDVGGRGNVELRVPGPSAGAAGTSPIAYDLAHVVQRPAVSGLVIADAAAPGGGQMTREEFLRSLRAAATEAASQTIGPLWSVVGCPYIDRWFALHADTDAPTLERIVARYAGLDAPASATDYVTAVRARLQDAIVRFRAGHDVAAELAAAGLVGDLRAITGGSGPGGPPAGSAPLDPAASSRFGAAFGTALPPVQVHTGIQAAQLADQHGAAAVTIGNEIAFGAGRHRPNTLEGDALLAHELAHVLQQERPPDAPRRATTSGGEGGELEEDADRVAYGAMARLYAGVEVAGTRRPRRHQGLRLQRCSTKKKRTITDPFVLSLDTKLRTSPPDKMGVFNDIRALAGAKAGDAALRDGIDVWFDEGMITEGEMFHAVALQELGEERKWPTVVKNFADGADRSIFRVPSLPPAGADALREYSVRSAGEAAGAVGLAAVYQNRFNAKWNVPPYAALPAELDETLDSKGPRNRRARRIFDDLYNGDPAIKSAYDSDSPAGFRNLCDTLVGPEGANLIASPRLEELRRQLSGSALTFSSTADPAYVAFTATLRPTAEALDEPDRLEIKRSHSWWLLVDARVRGSTPSGTQELRDDTWSVLTTSRPTVPIAPAPAVPVPPEPAPTLNAAQSAFLSGIVLAAPLPPQDATTDQHPLAFDIHSSAPNPALAARRKIVVEPAAQVVDGQEDESPWPSGATAMPHLAKVNPESGVGPATTFTAKLTVPPVPTLTFPEKSATVTVNDKRIDWFKATVKAGVSVMEENVEIILAPGGAVPYFGGQLPIVIEPTLSGVANPGLTVSMEGDLTKGGVPFKTLPRKPFPAGAPSAPLFDTILEQPPVPPLVAEKMVLTIRFFTGSGPGLLFHTLSFPFDIIPALPPAGDAALLALDNTALNEPIGIPGTFLFDMVTAAPPGSPQALVAHAAATGSIKVQSCIVRSDSAAWLRAKGHDPTKQVAYALGQLDDAHTMAERPGAAGWRTPMFPDTVFLNLTPNTHLPAKRTHAEMAELLTHEGIHALDRIPPGNWGSYIAEFRAYWVMGLGAGLSTAPDPKMSNIGPKSPRARAIFEHLYGSPTYPFVRTDYDANMAGFRAKVDAYLYPDGINLALSTQLADLRKEIESYTGWGFSAKKAAISARFAACSAADRAQITNNREWRDLVEEKFTGTIVVWEMPPKLKREKDEIKALLGIPL